jgi:hypothetical protein
MVMLFFNKNDCSVKVVGYCEGGEAVSKKAKLLRNGYTLIDKSDGRYNYYKYATYKCNKHNEYEIYYFKVNKDSGATKYMLNALRIVDVVNNCEIMEKAKISCLSYVDIDKLIKILEKLNDEDKEALLKNLDLKEVRKLIENFNDDIENFKKEFVKAVVLNSL